VKKFLIKLTRSENNLTIYGLPSTGLTGTLPDSLLASWNVIGKIGPILYEKNSYELRKQQTITDVEIKVILCQHQRMPVFQRGPNPTDKYNAEFDYVIGYSPRNEVIKKIANKLSGNVLIVVDRLDYISELSKLFNGGEKKVFIITGDTPTDERTEIQNTMDRESGIICIAMSKCFSTGISIKNLHYAIFAYMGKGGVKTVQTIGRTVRKHESKSKAVIFDIADNLEYSTSHLRERIKMYKNQKIDYSISKIKI
jgi:superfamily II DNA or RNA helicase